MIAQVEKARKDILARNESTGFKFIAEIGALINETIDNLDVLNSTPFTKMNIAFTKLITYLWKLAPDALEALIENTNVGLDPILNAIADAAAAST